MVERNGQWAHGRGVAWRTLVRTIRTIRTFFVTVRTIRKLTRLNTHTAKSDLVENDLHLRDSTSSRRRFQFVAQLVAALPAVGR